MSDVSLERTLVRTREVGTTVSAWRMVVDDELGSGTITLIDMDRHPAYRGDGIFFGWTQDKLAAEYQRLNKPSEEPQLDFPQLG